MINFRKYKKESILLILLAIIAIAFLIFKENKLYISIGTMIIMGIYYFFIPMGLSKKEKIYPLRHFYTISGISFFIFGISLLVFKFNIYISIILLAILFITILYIINNKEKNLPGMVLTLFFFIFSLKVVSYLWKDFIIFIFQKNPENLLFIITDCIIFIFVVSSLYIFISYLIRYVSKYKRGSFLKKLDNNYFLIGIVLIILILIIGISGIREFYIEDYPLQLSFQGDEEIIINEASCESKEKSYFVDGDWVECIIILKDVKGGYLYGKTSMAYKNELNDYKPYNTSFYSFDGSNLHQLSGKFMLNKKYKEYTLQFNFYEDLNNKEDKFINIQSTLYLNIKSTEEYNKIVERRTGLIIGLFSIILFSVFSAMANLKSILEETK